MIRLNVILGVILLALTGLCIRWSIYANEPEKSAETGDSQQKKQTETLHRDEVDMEEENFFVTDHNNAEDTKIDEADENKETTENYAENEEKGEETTAYTEKVKETSSVAVTQPQKEENSGSQENMTGDMTDKG